MERQPDRVPLRVPELGLGETDLTVSVWLVPQGSQVAAGERIVELVAGPVMIDLPAPASGRLVDKVIAEDTVVQTDSLLGWIEREPASREFD